MKKLYSFLFVAILVLGALYPQKVYAWSYPESNDYQWQIYNLSDNPVFPIYAAAPVHGNRSNFYYIDFIFYNTSSGYYYSVWYDGNFHLMNQDFSNYPSFNTNFNPHPLYNWAFSGYNGSKNINSFLNWYRCLFGEPGLPIYYGDSFESRVLYTPIQASFDGSVSVEGFTVTNTKRYIQPLTYNIAFSQDLANQFASSIWNAITGIKLNYYYDLQVPTLDFIQSTSSVIANQYGGSFSSWYSERSTLPQTSVCNQYASFVINPKDHTLDKNGVNFGIDTDLSSFAAQIYGRQLNQNEQYLFDTLTYVRTVGVRLRWLLSDVFGYGPLKIINIGPTLLNGRAINGNGFGGSASTDNVNSYPYNQNDIPDTDFNNTDNVTNNNTSVFYPSQETVTNNYNTYYNTVNYYPVVSSPAIQNVYVVNYEDFTSNITNSSNQEIVNNYEFNFGDLNISSGITDAANEVNNAFSDLTSGENGGVAKIGADFISVVPSDIAMVLFGIIGASIIALVINKMRS